MSEELKQELEELSMKELFELYTKITDLKKQCQSNIITITEEDLKPKRKKRGSKK